MQQAQHAFHPLVAGIQHLERGFVARTGRTVAGQGEGVQVDAGHVTEVPGRHRRVEGWAAAAAGSGQPDGLAPGVEGNVAAHLTLADGFDHGFQGRMGILAARRQAQRA